MISFAKDILRCLKSKQHKEHEANQHHDWVQKLFYKPLVTDLKGVNLSSRKFLVPNRIFSKKCVEFDRKH